MDPLSVSTAILTILNAVSVTIKAVEAFRNAPKELEKLMEELEHITNVANHINALTKCRDFPDVNLSLCLSRAHAKLGNAQAVVEKRLAQKTHKGVFSLRLTTWLHQKSHIEQLTQDLMCMRHDLTATLDILNLSVLISTAEMIEYKMLLPLTFI